MYLCILVNNKYIHISTYVCMNMYISILIYTYILIYIYIYIYIGQAGEFTECGIRQQSIEWYGAIQYMEATIITERTPAVE
jgi:hypothetical protein